MKKQILYSASVLAVVGLQAVSITSFGSIDYTIDGGLTDFATSQNLSSVGLSGNDGSTLAGTLNAAFNLSSYIGDDVYVSGNSVSDPGETSFSVVFYDSAFKRAFYVGGSWTSIDSNGFTSLSFDNQETGFDASDVLYVDVVGGGLGSNLVSAVLDDLNTAMPVPEPSTAAALAGLAALGTVMVRRRRR